MNTTRTEPYTGPFPRKKHSHKCLTCLRRHQTITGIWDETSEQQFNDRLVKKNA